MLLPGEQADQVLLLVPEETCPWIMVSPVLCPKDLLEERQV